MKDNIFSLILFLGMLIWIANYYKIKQKYEHAENVINTQNSLLDKSIANNIELFKVCKFYKNTNDSLYKIINLNIK